METFIGISQPVSILSSLALAAFIGHQVYHNRDSGTILALTGVFGLAVFLTILAFNPSFSVIIYEKNMTFLVMAVEVIASIAAMCGGYTLFVKHTKKDAAKAAEAALEKKRLKAKAERADRGIITNMFTAKNNDY